MNKPAQPTFLDLIDRLTRTAGSYQVYVPNDEGTIVKETRYVPGLLEQLRAAVFAGMEGTGGSSAFGSRPPIDSAAADLLNEIDTQAAEALAAVVRKPTPLGTTEDYVASWATRTTEHERFTILVRRTVPNAAQHAGTRPPYRPVVFTDPTQYTALGLAQQWCDRIEDFFNPPSSRELPFPCPTCAADYVHRTKEGEHVRARALNLIRDGRTGQITEARCGNCGTTWQPNMFERLAVMIGGKTFIQVQEEIAAKEAAAEARAQKRRRHTAA